MNIQTKQPNVFRLFSTLIKNGRLQHAYLFEGGAGSGRLEMAKWLAQVKLCPQKYDQGLPCGECQVCRRIEREEHPDVWFLRPEGASIKVDQVRDVRQEFARSGMEAAEKVLIVDPIEAMTVSGANSLLKFLEEPVPDVTIILLTENANQLLPTIVSRVQTVHFQKQSPNDVTEYFIEGGIDSDQASILARLTQDLSQARKLSEIENFEQLLNIAWRFVTLMLEKNAHAFLYVQTNLKELVFDRETTQLFLDILLIIYQDLLNVKYQQDHSIAFMTRKKEIDQYAHRQSDSELIKQIDTLFEAKSMLQANVAIQSVLEKIALNNLKSSR